MHLPGSAVTIIAVGTLACAATSAQAQRGTRAYKCVSASGHVSFQDTPCSRRERQHTMDLRPLLPPASSPPPAAVVPADRAAATPRPPPPAAPAPEHNIPVLYACRRATDGTRYISRGGQPRPYYVPLGILGWPPRPLSGQLATPDPPGAATPPDNRTNRSIARLAGTYTQVRDHCRQLSIPATCRELRKEHDAIEETIRKAFRSDRPPLQQREKALQSELSSCR